MSSFDHNITAAVQHYVIILSLRKGQGKELWLLPLINEGNIFTCH
jgi:hypothetical protein